MAEIKRLTAECHCHKVRFTIAVPEENLLLKVHLCHCSICRYMHGAPCCFHAPLPSGVAPEFLPPSSLNQLTAYEIAGSKSKRYFCSTCGCHIGDQAQEDGRWVISNSIFDANREDKGIWEFATHLHSNSTADGGLSVLVPTIEDRRLETVNPEPSASSAPTNTESSELRAQCHCGGVSFCISRPKADFQASSAGHKWLSPMDRNKWLACMDLCDDCRLTTGTHVIGWVFVPVDHISPPSADLMIGSSKSYRSTIGVQRTFCGTCGATVSYSCDERPGIVDVATGLLRAPEGAMAENWLVWRAGRAAWPENGLRYHPGFSQALIEGMKPWGKEPGHAEDFVV